MRDFSKVFCVNYVFFCIEKALFYVFFCVIQIKIVILSRKIPQWRIFIDQYIYYLLDYAR
jgi:hypothetical protein